MSKKETQIEKYLFDQNEVINRFLEVVGATNDTDYAKIRDLPRSTVGTWRKRDSIPYAECEYFFREMNISMDWMLTGQGEMYRDNRPTQVSQDVRNYGKDSNVVTQHGVHNNTHIVAKAGEGYPRSADKGGRDTRLCQFIEWWMESHDPDDQAWLEKQIERAVPEYAQWKKG